MTAYLSTYVTTSPLPPALEELPAEWKTHVAEEEDSLLFQVRTLAVDPGNKETADHEEDDEEETEKTRRKKRKRRKKKVAHRDRF